jgi:hypothetical protein
MFLTTVVMACRRDASLECAPVHSQGRATDAREAEIVHRNAAVGASAKGSWADNILSAGAALWFAATLAGQAVFFYYIAAFYGPTTLTGDYAGWDRNPFLRKGYVEGDEIGNLAFAAHVIVAAIVTFGGMIQFVPQIRARAIAFHRWNGRAFMIGACLAALSGLYMVWKRGEIGEIVSAIAISLNGVLILVFAPLAWANAVAGNIPAHRRWAIRTFMVVSGVFFLRLMVSSWIVIMQKGPGALFQVLEFASYLAPLLLLEFYFRARAGGAFAKLAMAAILAVAASLTAVGIFGFMMIFVNRVLAAV